MSSIHDASPQASTCLALEAEFKALHGPLPPEHEALDTVEARLASLRALTHALGDARWALCLSGGGVRSATFCLGVLQGLAEAGVLSRFHFLSTVSGGGYIGAWLSSWITRESQRQPDAPLDDILRAGLLTSSARDQDRVPGSEPRTVSRLRAYSSFLAPMRGLSGDTLALVGTFLRNLLLHWAVVIPLLMALLMLPRAHLAALLAGTGQLELAVALAAAALFVAIAYMASDLPPSEPGTGPRNWFVPLCAVPLLIAAVLLSWVGAWLSAPGSAVAWRLVLDTPAVTVLGRAMPWWATLVLAGMALHMFAAVTGSLLRGLRGSGRRRRSSPLWEFAAAAASGALGGGALYLAIDALADLGSAPQANRGWMPLYAVLAVPALLAVFWLAVTTFAGLTRRFKSEDDREWWSRAGGQWLALAAAWMVLHLLVLFVPPWLLALPWLKEVPGYASLGGGALGLGVVSSLWGYWSRQGPKIRHQVQGLAERLGMRVLDLAALAFLLMLAVALSVGASAALQAGLAPVDQQVQTRLQQLTTEHREQQRCKAPCPAGCTPANCPASPPPNLPAADQAAAAYQVVLSAVPAACAFGLMVALLVLGAGAAWFTGVNAFSLHSMYCNRLTRAYLGGARHEHPPHPRRPHWFTGFDADDNLPLADTLRPQSPRLLHVVNVALNLVAPSGGRLEWQQRKAASFTMSPLHCGSPVAGFVATRDYGRKAEETPTAVQTLRINPEGQTVDIHLRPTGGMSLGRAMAISGAAAAPSMGYHSSAVVALTMSFFNIRLGWWLPNPGAQYRANWHRDEPHYGLEHLIAEAAGLTTEKSSFVYLSDGGHFENLGLYEMVRRRCRTLVVVDATQDPEYRYADLESSLRKIRIDFGISIQFPFELPTPDSARRTGQHVAVGIVKYSDVDGPVTDGTLVYIKPVLSGDEPLDLENYARDSVKGRAPFPHQLTSDQFFDEAQFEAYRLLGLHSVQRWLGSRAGKLGLEGLKAPDHRPPAAGAAAGAAMGSGAAGSDTTSGGSTAVDLAGKAGTAMSDAARYSLVALGSAALAVTGTLSLKDPTVSLRDPTVTIGNPVLRMEAASAPAAGASAGTGSSQISISGGMRAEDRELLTQVQRDLQDLRTRMTDLARGTGNDLRALDGRLTTFERTLGELLKRPQAGLNPQDLASIQAAATALAAGAKALSDAAARMPAPGSASAPLDRTAKAVDELRLTLESRLKGIEAALSGLRPISSGN